MTQELMNNEVPSSHKQWGWTRKKLLSLAGFLLLGWLGFHLLYVFALGNFYEVKPGLVYRSSQLSGTKLESVIRKNNIKTVINLRGCCDTVPWYTKQCEAINRCDISQEDLSFSAGRLPSTKTIRMLMDVIDHSEKPMIFHCHKGVDRTGMAVVMSLLLLTDTPLDNALKQLGPYYGHLNIGRTAHIDEFFELYRDWLVKNGRQHSSEIFRNWVMNHYVPGDCFARLELKEAQSPIQLEPGKPRQLQVKVTNISLRPWKFKPGSNAGIKLEWRVSDNTRRTLASGFAGHFNATVNPGEALDLAVVIPPLKQTGSFLLRMDMNDRQHAAFHQTGSEILEAEVLSP